jgi:lipopolysaccharide/colanic/teichoic acid biosynthesis glycosyltransferase
MSAARGIPRAVEVPAAALALLALAPVLLACAAVVGVTSGPPVLFRQRRMGWRGRPFVLLKFRTMRTSAPGAPQITADGDDRITPVGHLLRRTKLDELPQLWNVVRGEMSLVGPRPEALIYVDPRESRWQQVLRARPGLTDPVTLALRDEQQLLAQIDGDREAFYMETLQPFKLRGYVDYLERRSWRTDLRVLWDTALSVLAPGRGPVITMDDIKAVPR